MAHLRGLNKLTLLNLHLTEVTCPRVNELKQALPTLVVLR